MSYKRKTRTFHGVSILLIAISFLAVHAFCQSTADPVLAQVPSTIPHLRPLTDDEKFQQSFQRQREITVKLQKLDDLIHTFQKQRGNPFVVNVSEYKLVKEIEKTAKQLKELVTQPPLNF